MIEKNCEILKKTRQFILNTIADLSIDELNEIPPGFNNNIVWNLAHVMASQQGVCYVRAGLPLRVREELFNSSKPGTKPEATVSAGELEERKLLLFSTIDTLEADYKAGHFAKNPAWTNRYGVEHGTIDDSINFILFHDGLHSGVITAMKKIIVAEKV